LPTFRNLPTARCWDRARFAARRQTNGGDGKTAQATPARCPAMIYQGDAVTGGPWLRGTGGRRTAAYWRHGGGMEDMVAKTRRNPRYRAPAHAAPFRCAPAPSQTVGSGGGLSAPVAILLFCDSHMPRHRTFRATTTPSPAATTRLCTPATRASAPAPPPPPHYMPLLPFISCHRCSRRSTAARMLRQRATRHTALVWQHSAARLKAPARTSATQTRTIALYIFSTVAVISNNAYARVDAPHRLHCCGKTHLDAV